MDKDFFFFLFRFYLFRLPQGYCSINHLPSIIKLSFSTEISALSASLFLWGQGKLRISLPSALFLSSSQLRFKKGNPMPLVPTSSFFSSLQPPYTPLKLLDSVSLIAKSNRLSHQTEESTLFILLLDIFFYLGLYGTLFHPSLPTPLNCPESSWHYLFLHNLFPNFPNFLQSILFSCHSSGKPSLNQHLLLTS